MMKNVKQMMTDNFLKSLWVFGIVLSLGACQQGNRNLGYNGYATNPNQRDNYNYAYNANQDQAFNSQYRNQLTPEQLAAFQSRFGVVNPKKKDPNEDPQNNDGVDPFEDVVKYEIKNATNDWNQDKNTIEAELRKTNKDSWLIKDSNKRNQIQQILNQKKDRDGDGIPDLLEVLLSGRSYKFDKKVTSFAALWNDGLSNLGLQIRPGLDPYEYNGWMVGHHLFAAEDIALQGVKRSNKKGLQPVAYNTNFGNNTSSYAHPDNFYYTSYYGSAKKKKNRDALVLRSADEQKIWKEDTSDLGTKNSEGINLGLLSSLTGNKFDVEIAKRISANKKLGFSDYPAAKELFFFSRRTYWQLMERSSGYIDTNALRAYMFSGPKLHMDYDIYDLQKKSTGQGSKTTYRYEALHALWSKLSKDFQDQENDNAVDVTSLGASQSKTLAGVMVPREGRYKALEHPLEFSVIPGGDNVTFPFQIDLRDPSLRTPTAQVFLSAADANIDTFVRDGEWASAVEAYYYVPEEKTLVLGKLMVPAKNDESLFVVEGSDANLTLLIENETTKLIYSQELGDEHGDTSALRRTYATIKAADPECPWVRLLFFYAGSAEQYKKMKKKESDGSRVVTNEIYEKTSDGVLQRIAQSDVRILPPQCAYTKDQGTVPFFYDDVHARLKDSNYEEEMWHDLKERGVVQSQAVWMDDSELQVQVNQSNLESAADLATLETQWTQIAGSYGGANNVPAEVKNAYDARKQTLTNQNQAAQVEQLATQLGSTATANGNHFDINVPPISTVVTTSTDINQLNLIKGRVQSLLNHPRVSAASKSALQPLIGEIDTKVASLSQTPFEAFLEDPNVDNQGSFGQIIMAAGRNYVPMTSGSTLTTTAKAELDGKAPTIFDGAVQDGVYIHIVGHADGNDTTGNKNMSYKRAKAVYDYLIAHMTSQGNTPPAGKIVFYGLSTTEPLSGQAPTADVNRRVEIRVFQSAAAPTGAVTNLVSGSRPRPQQSNNNNNSGSSGGIPDTPPVIPNNGN
ncbi:MAG: hypothetical protein KDD52_06305 [Bdellovibrionales bacterium]|nr:hypothetical protein [Bdellovibrionales bacterium]